MTRPSFNPGDWIADAVIIGIIVAAAWWVFS